MLRLKTIGALIILALALIQPATAQIIDYPLFEKAKKVGDRLTGEQLRALQSDLAWNTGYNSLRNWPLWGGFDESTFHAVTNFQRSNRLGDALNPSGIPSPELIKRVRQAAVKMRTALGFKTVSVEDMSIDYPAKYFSKQEELPAGGRRLSSPEGNLTLDLQTLSADQLAFDARYEAMKASPDFGKLIYSNFFKAKSGRNPTYFVLFGGDDNTAAYARFIKAADGSARGLVIRWNTKAYDLPTMFEIYDAFGAVVGSLKLTADDSELASDEPAPSTPSTASLDANRKLCGQAKEADAIIKACSDVLAVGELLLPSTRQVTSSNRGYGYYLKGDYDRAIADYNTAIALDSDNETAFAFRGYSRFGKGDNAQAIADFDTSLRLKPGNLMLLSYRASAALKLGRLQETIDNTTAVIKGGAKPFPADFLNRGIALLELGRNDEAEADLAKADDIATKDLAEDADKNKYDYIYRAMARAYGNDPDGAIADATRYLSIDPKSAEAFHARGLAYLAKLDQEQALADLTKAIELGRKSFILRQRGNVYLAMGQPDLAAADYLAMLRQFPTNPLALAGLGMAKQAMLQKSGTQAPPPGSATDTPASPGLNPPTPAQAPIGRRIALIIGNSAYSKFGELPNPTRDAAKLAETLRGIGFTEVALVENLDNQAFNRALQDFSDKASQADWAVIYYAGHGMEVDNVNYLLPVDAKLAHERDIIYEAIPLDRVMAAGEGAKTLRLVILDACRDNPFQGAMAKKTATRSVTRGLSRVEPDGATLVAYAAKAGQVAQDGDGGNSPFVTALVSNLNKPNVEIGKLFRLVRDDVMKATDRQQEPFTYGSLPGEDFIFNPGK
jgi:tetratricopeptide (TPR) repeat protein